jgi:hypothetical protein
MNAMAIMYLTYCAAHGRFRHPEDKAMTDNVKFRLPGPFGLPAAQKSRAYPLNGTVELRIRAFVEGASETLVIQMAREVAQEMAAQLLDAAEEAKVE